MKLSSKLIIILTIISIFVSCESRENMVFFQNIDSVNIQEQSVLSNPVIQIGDMLSISVSALDVEAVKPFNLPVVSINNISGSVNGAPKQQGYRVMNDQSIIFPILGKIKLGGLTIPEAQELVVSKLAGYIKSPIVNIEIINFKVTILGDVTNPGTFPVENERISILQAIGLAGGLTIQGKRDNVLIIRESSGSKEYKHIDLRDAELLNSEYYFLQQNDVVYVEPNKTKINSSKYGPAVPVTVSIVSTIIALISVLTR